HLAWLYRPAMISFRASRRRRCLDNIKTIDFFLAFADPAARGKISRVTKRAGHGRKKISVERQNAISFAEVVDSIDRLTKSHDCAGTRVVGIRGFVLMPLRLWKLSKNSFELSSESGRRHRLSQKTNAGSLLRSLFIECGANFADKGGPGARLVAVQRRLRAIGIVESED